MSIDRRLSSGPLRVRPLWDDNKTLLLPDRVLAVRRRRFKLRAAASAVAMVCVAFALGTWADDAQEPVAQATRSDTQARSAGAREEERKTILLDDGSRVELEKGARLVLGEQESGFVRTILSEGRASFSVVPNRERNFEVRAGDVVVRVLGTKFEVSRRGGEAEVSVTEGLVRVSWPGGSAHLSAGDSGVFPPKVRQPSSAKKLPATDERTAARPSAASEPEADWRDLARNKDYSAAFSAMQIAPQGLESSAADLMLAADVARLSRHPQEAARLLQKVTQQFPSDPRAPLAAFTRGRILVENLGNPGAAAKAFLDARRLAPAGALAADALVREMTARQSMGQSKQARALARTYLRSYPDGRHRAQCEQLASPD